MFAVAGIYNNLIRINPENTNELIGDLATHWETSSDGLSLKVFLREGVKFHDGMPFTSADVKATFDRALDPDENGSRFPRPVKSLIERVEILDEFTVRFVQKAPGLLLVTSLSSDWMKVVPKHLLDEEGGMENKAIGTGPFMFKSWDRDVQWEWERNPNYYEPGLPFLDSLINLQVADRAPLIAALATDQMSMWMNSPQARPSDAEEVIRQAGAENIVVSEFPLGIIHHFVMNVTVKPFDDPKVRRAIHLALDRQEYLDKVVEGLGIVGAVMDPQIYGDVSLPQADIESRPGIRQPKDEDIAKAKELMKEAGFAEGFKVDGVCLAQNTEIGQLFMEIPMAQLKRTLGIECDVQPQDRAAVFAALPKGEFTLYGHSTGVQFKDPDSLFGFLWAEGAGRNWGQWTDPEFEKMYQEQLTSTDPVRRRELHVDLQNYLLDVDSGGAVPQVWWNALNIRRSYVKGWHPLGPHFDARRMDRVWFDK